MGKNYSNNNENTTGNRRSGESPAAYKRRCRLEEQSRRQSSAEEKKITSRKSSAGSKPIATGKKSGNDKKIVKAQKSARDKAQKGMMGVMLNKIQILLSCVFLACLLLLNLLPWLWVAIIAVVLAILAAWNYMGQSKRNKHRGLGKICSVFISAGLVFGAYYCLMILSLLINISGDNDSALKLNRDSYSVYISGIDVYGGVEQTSRSDVNLISTINPSTGQILLTTTPRDYYVEIPGVTNGTKDKLTHAGNYGIETSMATLESIYDESIELYIRVNFTSFIDIVNELGGVTVHSDLAFTTGEESGCIVDIKEGANELNGEQALAFARERHNLPDGDVQRGKNQQLMLEAIFREVLSPVTAFKLSDLLECIEGDVETNMTTRQLQQCSRGVLKNVLNMNLHSVAASGTQDRAMCYSYPSKSLYVTIPDQSSVEQIKEYMDIVAAGGELSE